MRPATVLAFAIAVGTGCSTAGTTSTGTSSGGMELAALVCDAGIGPVRPNCQILPQSQPVAPFGGDSSICVNCQADEGDGGASLCFEIEPAVDCIAEPFFLDEDGGSTTVGVCFTCENDGNATQEMNASFVDGGGVEATVVSLTLGP